MHNFANATHGFACYFARFFSASGQNFMHALWLLLQYDSPFMDWSQGTHHMVCQPFLTIHTANPSFAAFLVYFCDNNSR